MREIYIPAWICWREIAFTRWLFQPVSRELSHFVLSILDYCDTVWSCCGSVNTDKLEKFQRRAAHIVIRLGSSERALNFLGYVTLEKRRESHVRKLVKKCLSNRCPQFFMHYFNYNRDVLPRRTRSSDKLRIPSVKLECTKKPFFYHSCVIFNQI